MKRFVRWWVFAVAIAAPGLSGCGDSNNSPNPKVESGGDPNLKRIGRDASDGKTPGSGPAGKAGAAKPVASEN